VLVFAHHKGVLDALETAVKRMRVGEDGHTQQVPPNKTYGKLLDDYQNHHMKMPVNKHGCSCGNS
jgi:FKBP-type peptidyl-prolyl cis-trans isomerase 2